MTQKYFIGLFIAFLVVSTEYEMIPEVSSKRTVVIKTVETRDGEVGSPADQTCFSHQRDELSRNKGNKYRMSG